MSNSANVKTGVDDTAVGLIVDTETTGLGGHDELVEIGLIQFRYAVDSGVVEEVIDHYSGLREPKVAIHPDAFRAHGLDAAALVGATLDVARIKAMLSNADRIYAHNAVFDHHFVTPLFPLAASKTWVCTMKGIPWQAEGVPSSKLEDIAVFYAISRAAAHRALADAQTLLEALQRPDRTGTPHLLQLHRRASPLITDVPVSQKLDPVPPDAPYDDVTEIRFAQRTFCFTGEFFFGPKEHCERAVESAGAIVVDRVTSQLDYLVVGSQPSKRWAHPTHGTKIDTAVARRNRYGRPLIIREQDWVKALEEHQE